MSRRKKGIGQCRSEIVAVRLTRIEHGRVEALARRNYDCPASMARKFVLEAVTQQEQQEQAEKAERADQQEEVKS